MYSECIKTCKHSESYLYCQLFSCSSLMEPSKTPAVDKSKKVRKGDEEEDILKSSSACKTENKPVLCDCICKCLTEKEGKSPGKVSLSSSSSLQSYGSRGQAEHSVEWLMKTPACNRHPAPYSEETKRQIPAIKALVEKQQAETEAKEKAAKEGKDGGSNSLSVSAGEVGPQVSTTFAQDMAYIEEQIRQGREEMKRKEAERKEQKKLKKQQKKAAKEKEVQKTEKSESGGGELKKG